MDEKTYFDERKLLIEAERETAKTFDTSMITLASGALGLSLFFVREVTVELNGKSFLLASWVAFSVALVSTMCSFLTSQNATRRQREILDALLKDETRPSEGNRSASITNGLNLVSIFSFLIGIVFLCTFIYLNLANTKGAQNMDVVKFGSVSPKTPVLEKVQRGFVPPKTPADSAPVQKDQTNKQSQ